MRTMTVTAFKARCLTVLDEVARSGGTVVLLRRGKPIARVVGARVEPVAYPQHDLRGTVETVGDIVEPALPRSAWNASSPTTKRRR